MRGKLGRFNISVKRTVPKIPFNLNTISDHIASLIVKHLQEKITTDETGEMEKWAAANVQNRKLFELLTNDETLREELFANAESERRIKEQVYARITGDMLAGKEQRSK